MMDEAFDHDERTAELLRLLPPAPEAWVIAAKELAPARAALDSLLRRATLGTPGSSALSSVLFVAGNIILLGVIIRNGLQIDLLAVTTLQLIQRLAFVDCEFGRMKLRALNVEGRRHPIRRFYFVARTCVA